MKSKPHLSLYPRFPLRIAFTTFFFLLFAWLVGSVSPKPDIANSWFYVGGVLAYAGLIWANETIYNHAKTFRSSRMTWFHRFLKQSAIPLLVSGVLFLMFVFPLALPFEERPHLPMGIAATHWAYVYFPVMFLCSAMLLLLPKVEKRKTNDQNLDEMLGIFNADMTEMERIRKGFSAEPFLSQIRAALPLMWKEGMAKYLTITHDGFTRPVHQIVDPYFFRVLPPYGYRAMVARVNALVKTGNITIRDIPDFKDGTYVEMAYKSRKVRLRHPEATATINEMMGELSLLLMPDYQLRHCKLLSEPQFPYQWMVCLQPSQWLELELGYGSKRMEMYFGRVDRSYQAGLLPDEKTKEAALELFKLKFRLDDPLR